jgi:hypothetical protein
LSPSSLWQTFCKPLFSLTKQSLVFSSSFQKFTDTKTRTMSLFNTGKNKKDKKKGTLPQSKSTFIAPKGGGGAKANTKGGNNAGKHVGGAQRGA